MADITYTRVGDYFLPDIILHEPPPECVAPLDRYARMRRAYIKEYHPILYTQLLLSERLYPHLREIDEAATHRLAVIPDHEQAEEIINKLIYE